MRERMLEGPRQRVWAAVFAGVLLALATPPSPLGFAAWFALLPLLFALEKAADGSEAFRIGMWTGLIYHTGAIYWIAFNTGADWGARLTSAAGAIIVLTIWFGLVARLHYAAIRKLGRQAHLLLFLLWPAQEAVFVHGELGFPWATLALTQASYLPVIQLAAVGGTPLVTSWVAMINGVAAAGRDHRRTGVILLVLIAATWGAGSLRERAIRIDGVEHPLGEIALVQGNIDPAEKWKLGAEHSLQVYWSLTRQVISEERPLLVVWPETATPVYLQLSFRWRLKMQSFVDSIGVAVATGASHKEIVDDRLRRYNSAFLVRPGGGGRMERYDKVHLVPFGERVPFQKYFPDLGKLNFGQAEFTPGDSIITWAIQGKNATVRVAPLICYEAIFPDLGRKAVRAGADVLINLTNDGWLAGTSEPRQHLLLARFRSIETGRALVRATNTGISAIIQPSGWFSATLPEGMRGALVDTIAAPVRTIFLRGGWLMEYLFPLGALFAYLFVIFYPFGLGRKRGTAV